MNQVRSSLQVFLTPEIKAVWGRPDLAGFDTDSAELVVGFSREFLAFPTNR
ncbi:MAG: hypothetical protein ACI8UO_002316 [Verrucomicrobiales bacterium]|jgi:hypothetical protein